MSERKLYDEAHEILDFEVFRLFRLLDNNTDNQSETLSSYNFTDEEMILLQAYYTHYSNLIKLRAKIREIELKIRIQEKNHNNTKAWVFDEKNTQLKKSGHELLDKTRIEIDNLQVLKIIEEKKIPYCKKNLAFLEESKEMQSILKRFTPHPKDVHLTFANEYFEETDKNAIEMPEDNTNNIIFEKLIKKETELPKVKINSKIFEKQKRETNRKSNDERFPIVFIAILMVFMVALVLLSYMFK